MGNTLQGKYNWKCATLSDMNNDGIIPEFDKLASVEIQSIMHNLDVISLLHLSQCCKFLYQSSSHSFAWKYTPPLEVNVYSASTITKQLDNFDLILKRNIQSPLHNITLSLICDFKWTFSTNEEVQIMFESMDRHKKKITNLTLIDLLNNRWANNSSNLELLISLIKTGNLNKLCINYGDISGCFVRLLANAIKENGNFTVLDFSKNYIDNEDVMALCLAIQCNKSLTNLNLSYNRIKCTGVCVLSETLKQHCPNITSIDLSCNIIGPDGGIALSSVIKQCNRMTKISIYNNYITGVGAKALAEEIKHSKSMTECDFSRCNIGSEGIKAVVDAIKNNNRLIRIDLGENGFYLEDVILLANAIKCSTSMTDICLQSNYISETGINILIDAFNHCPTMSSMDLTNNSDISIQFINKRPVTTIKRVINILFNMTLYVFGQQ